MSHPPDGAGGLGSSPVLTGSRPCPHPGSGQVLGQHRPSLEPTLCHGWGLLSCSVLQASGLTVGWDMTQAAPRGPLHHMGVCRPSHPNQQLLGSCGPAPFLPALWCPQSWVGAGPGSPGCGSLLKPPCPFDHLLASMDGVLAQGVLPPLELGAMATRHSAWAPVWVGCGLDAKLTIVRGDRAAGSKASGAGLPQCGSAGSRNCPSKVKCCTSRDSYESW